MPEIEDGFRRATLRAAAAVKPEESDKSFLEKRLAAAIGRELEMEFGLPVLLNRKVPELVLDEWNPQPGPFDVVILDEEDRPFVVAELRLDDVDQTMWDIFKVASALKSSTVQTAFMVVACPSSTWSSARDVVGLYAEDNSEQWYTRYLFHEYRRAWKSLLRDGRGRPIELPATIFVSPILVAPVVGYPPYQLRCIQIGRTEGVVPIIEGWPPAKLRRDEVLDEELTTASLPDPDSDELAIHNFALTTSGYERMGSNERCASLANDAREHWRLKRALPSTLQDLRCCLFFEQRRWHHYGDPFDDEAMEYARALIEAMRPLVEAAPT